MVKKLKQLALVLSSAFLLIFIRLFYWQVINHKDLLATASKQHLSSNSISAERGKIFSSDKFPLVLNNSNYLLFADPSLLKISGQELSTKIKSILNKEIKLENKELTNKNIFWVPLLENLSPQEKEKISELKIEGIGFEEKKSRFYPEASMSGHLLGFVGNDDKKGKKGFFGLEGFYDNELKGRDGLIFFEKDALGRPIPLGEELKEKPISGRDLNLFLDRPLQYIVEKQLKEGIVKYKASSGLIAIMDPKTGAIISMAAFPNYNPETYFDFNSDLYRNPVVSSSFEPGSIFKVIVMASALDSKSIDPFERCTSCGGPKKIADYSIKTWNEKYYPNSTMTEVLVHSDNVGMVYVMEKLGRDRLYDYLGKFGFGEKTNIDLQGEAVPLIRQKNLWSEVDLATASFGQGIAVTPIQMLRAVAAIANKGILVQPRVVKSIIEDNKTIEILPGQEKKVILPDSADQIKEMMIRAVEDGEAKWARPRGYKIAGKTGTAQIPVAGHYDPNKTIASFVGFAPADDPKFVMLVTLTEPKSSPWGSETAAPLWFNIAKDIFTLWDIKPKN